MPDLFASALQHVLTTPRLEAAQDFDSWWETERELRKSWPDPRLRAVVLSAASDRLAFAFSAGFRAALVSLVPGVDPRGELRLAFCATEDGGAHPRAIQTQLIEGPGGLRLIGKKRWATLGSHAEELLVVARVGEVDGRPQLKLARVSAGAPGVVRGDVQEAPFCPELTHASFEFETDLGADCVLPGDGYADYLKPFRTLEDGHVQLALNAYLLGVTLRYQLDPAWVERWLAQLLACWSVCQLDPRVAGAHLALAGVSQRTEELLGQFEPNWDDIDGPERERWLRDQPLLQVASRARSMRQAAARKAVLRLPSVRE